LIGVLQQLFRVLDDEAQVADQPFLRLRVVSGVSIASPSSRLFTS
jgi:hypothetical protein